MKMIKSRSRGSYFISYHAIKLSAIPHPAFSFILILPPAKLMLDIELSHPEVNFKGY